ncbi:MAG: Rrf2 family transcriptional regulator, partial [Chloroflexi bacterium]|nr:Rrf2 family transcriptional regulator [Chloroflexota bacterium]
MHTSSRFAVAVHTLVFLALRKNENDSVTSDMIASSVNTNPVVIRRILGTLRESKIVSSQSGACGGWYLNRKPEAISLRDIYHSLENDPLFAMPRHPANARCDIGRNMQAVLDGYFKKAERAAAQRLDHVTLAQVMNSVMARAEK